MTFWDWLTPNFAGVVGLLATVLSAGVAALQVWRKTQVELKQIRPEVVTHGCRIWGEAVYTYFDENKRVIGPACVYLAKDGSLDCKFDPASHQGDTDKRNAEQRLAINEGKCYLALWGPKPARE